MKTKDLVIVIVIGIVVVCAVYLKYFWKSNFKSEVKFGSISKELHPVDSITHAHGLSVDSTGQNVYIATHYGLYVLKNDKDLYQIGDSNDDYMGFSAHPSNSKIFFTSGHPESGGNIGFNKSEDGGYTWSHVSDVANTPVDFHAMASSPINPKLIYGWFQGKIYKTSDSGSTWSAFPTKVVVTGLVADSKDENIVYALTPQGQGVLVSKDRGKDFQVLSDKLAGGIVSSFAINPQDNQMMIVYSEKLGGMGKSIDGGKTWQKINIDFGGGEVLFTAYAKQDSSIIYALTHLNTIYKSIDAGSTWNKIR